MATPKWRKLVDHVQGIKEGVYEDNYDNDTRFGRQYGDNMNGQPWCVIFDWCMYADVGLEKIVPKTALVAAFAEHAKEHGQWSEYPSVGAWVDFHNGGHTELVVGFDETHVYTKGGNSVEAGAEDASKGNGVFSHKTERKDPKVTGYFAPKFPDDKCPPTADPHDHRGGKAVKEWRWAGHRLPHEDHKVKASEVVYGQRNVSVRIVQAALKAEVGLDYSSAPGTFGPRTKAAVAGFQHKLGFKGADADGVFGRHSLVELGKRHNFRVYGLDFFDRKRDDDGKPGSKHEGIPVESVTYKHVPDGSCSRAAKEACEILKVPETHWVPGIMHAAKNESSYNFNAVNTWDSNATGPNVSDGHRANCSRGLLQCIPTTFAAYHQPGTSHNIYDGVANICAAMNYVMDHYGVRRDGSNLAGRVQQYDPNRDAKGY